MKTGLHVLCFALASFIFLNFSQAQGFKIEGFKHKEFQGVTPIPELGYAVNRFNSGKMKVDIVDFEGNPITSLNIPMKLLKTSKFREEKPKVIYNGTSFLVVMPKNLGKQSLFTFSVDGKPLGDLKIGGNIFTIAPKEEGYLLKGGGAFAMSPEVVYNNQLKEDWTYQPKGSTKYNMKYILSGGENITSKYLPYAQTEGWTMNKEYLDSYPVFASGTEDRLFFELTDIKGVDKTKNEGIVCLSQDGKEIFSDRYEKGMRKFLSAVSHNKTLYVLYRKYEKKGANGKSIAEVVKYDENGKVLKTVELAQTKLPVMSDYKTYHMEKTADGIGILADARGYFYGAMLSEDLELKSSRAFEGKNYKSKNSPPKMSAIGSFPQRGIFSGVTSSGIPYAFYLDKKSGVETARATSFTGKNMLNRETEGMVEKQIQVYYGTLSPLGLLRVDYGDTQSHFEIYANLVHPVDNDKFAVATFLETEKILLIKEYPVESVLK